MSNSDGTATIGELAAILVQEISRGLILARQEAPIIQVDSIRLRLGQCPEEGEEPLLHRERYPQAASGWELEIFSGGELSRKTISGRVEPDRMVKTALDLFGPFPVTAIKGVRRDWRDTFEGEGISTIGELAAMPDKALFSLLKRTGSRRPREFRGKARMLEVPVPALPPSPLATMSLYSLLSMDAAQMRSKARGLITPAEAVSLVDVAETLAVALDVHVLKKIPVGKLTGT